MEEEGGKKGPSRLDWMSAQINTVVQMSEHYLIGTTFFVAGSRCCALKLNDVWLDQDLIAALDDSDGTNREGNNFSAPSA